MAPAAHSKFSASASARLLACPGSYAVAIALDDGKRRSSIFAAEGTLAHSLSEACLHSGVDPVSFLGDTRHADGYTFTVDEDMVEHVREFVDHVRGLELMGYAVMLETRVNPTHHWDGLPPLNVDMFGTADVIGYNPATKSLRVVDLKFGRGVVVEPKGNTQGLYYSAGAMDPIVLSELCRTNGVTYGGVNTLTITIIQPRAYHPAGPVRSFTYDAADVREWAREVLYPGVDKALSDNGQTLCAGKHCRFCPAASVCEALKNMALDTAKAAFLAAPATNLPASAPPSAIMPQITLSDEALGDLLNKIEIIGPWMDAVKQMALDRLTEGKSVDGWKLVPKRPVRKWADEDQAAMIATLDAALSGCGTDQITDVKLLTPAQVEKKLGKKVYEALVAPHVVKVSSGKNLAPELDPRSAASRQTAREAFGITGGTSGNAQP